MPVEMILGDVEKNADRRIERRREIDLIGRAFDHVRAAFVQRLERQDRGPDIAAHLGVVPGRAQEVRGQRGGGRLAVGAGDGDERRRRCDQAPLAAEQLDVADNLDAGGVRKRGRPVRGRMRQRHARRKHKRRHARPIDLAQIGGRNAGTGRLDDGLRVVVPADDIGAAGEQRARARQPRAAQAEDGDLFSGKDGDRDHAAPLPPREPQGGRSRTQTCGVLTRRSALRDTQVTATSAWRVQRARARPRRSRSGSRSGVRSSRAARNGGGSAPCETRACRSA